MSKAPLDIDIFEYPLDTIEERFEFESGRFFLPTLRIDNLGRQEPTVRLWDEADPVDIPLSALLSASTSNTRLKICHPNQAFDGQIITTAVRGGLIFRALVALDEHHVVCGRYRVSWVDYNILPQGWPDRAAFMDELLYLFPGINAQPPESNSYREPIVVSSLAKGPDGCLLFSPSYSVGVEPAFAKWVESRGFTAYLPDGGGAPEIIFTKVLEEVEAEQEERTGWCVFPVEEAQH